MTITATSHAFAAGDIDYINNLNLVRTDVGSLITDANSKGTMSTQNANAVAITGGTISLPKYVATQNGYDTDLAYKIDGTGSWVQKNLIGHGFVANDFTTIRVPSLSLSNQSAINLYSSGHFEVKNLSGSTNFTCNSTGDVGVGTSSPLSDLDIYGGSGDGSSFDSVLTLSRTSSTGNVLACKWVLDDKSVNYGNMVLRIKTTPSGAESEAYYTDALTVDGQNGNLLLGGINQLLGTMIELGATKRLGFTANNTDAYVFSTGPLSVNVTSSDPLVFSTNNTERCRLTSTGNVLVNTTTDNGSDKLQVNGTASATSPAGGANNTQLATTAWVVAKGYISSGGTIQSTSPTSGVGYATGAGGSVTQTSSFTTAVSLNKVCGRITTFSGSLAAGERLVFQLDNTTISNTDNVVVNMTPDGSSGAGDSLVATCIKVGSGYCRIALENRGGGATPTGTSILNFTVIKSVNS